ncbi:conserved hypothetical protein [Methylorubrum populi BJ001]|jgi:hypothetical protein|uniref:Cysteine rich repeat protein n=1 Tax=Methylorubrum populi (strain ATCC BAA-705 / NCIMB 13946 / BJ001) TaxID=441620 RepID=B1Z9M7_METPB|nr:hypothetical protein [Methylorubrum populi]ACB81991.1 conserved hypothetical protein [Methylorubrum populi BJ001]OAH22732.1 hypothetical protein AX289_06465 [Methylorubrum populi]PZP69193.1 MAG: hypothetical protein DI590_14890 [Methylorubrum populi]
MVRIGTRTMLALIAFSAAGTASVRAGEEEQAALCRDDVMRLCLTSIPDRGRIVSCMRAQRASLSPGCRAVLDKGTAATAGRHSASLR